MFRKHFTGREVIVYPSEAEQQQAQKLEREIALEEEINS